MKHISLVLALCLLLTSALAAPYSWKADLPGSYRSPSDELVSGALKGACLQGGLVDVRYGQLAIEQGGTSEVLEVTKRTVLTLDGQPLSAEALQQKVATGLAATARYNPQSGEAGWVDAFSHGGASLRIDASISAPRRGFYTEGETIAIQVSSSEVKRLKGVRLSLTIPGMVHNLALAPAGGGSYKAVVRVLSGWNFSRVPIFISLERSDKNTVVAQGPSLSVATTAPEIIGFGPKIASAQLTSVPGWIDVRSEAKLLNPSSARLVASPGCRITKFQPRVGRSMFYFESDGPGEYWLEFNISDLAGHKATRRWSVKVVP